MLLHLVADLTLQIMCIYILVVIRALQCPQFNQMVGPETNYAYAL